MTEEGRELPETPDRAVAQPVIRRARGFRWSWIWLVPLLALAVGLTLLASAWVRSGPVITISFPSADGLAAGQTKLRYRDVAIGEVRDIRVADDRTQVLVDIQLKREGSQFITQKQSKFWIVHPQISMAGVTGLNTLLSGVYIAVDAPAKLGSDKAVYSFQGLAHPPEVMHGQVGTRFTLTSNSLGSLDIGSRVYYRRIEVGRVVGYHMSPDGRAVKAQIFVQAPYDQYVTADTRFWNSSGVDMSISPQGVNLRTSSLSSILNGGIEFAQADESSAYDGIVDDTPAKPDSEYILYDSRDAALADADGQPFAVELRFDESVRGLNVGAVVDFRGMPLGKVIDIDLEYDVAAQRFYAKVRAQLFPMRFSEAYRELVESKHGKDGAELLKVLVDHGLRAQLRTASLLTGQQYVALDFFPDAEPASEIDPKQPADGYLVPTEPGQFNRMQHQIGRIVSKLDELPLDDIGDNLNGSLKSLHQLLENMNTQLTPQASRAMVSLQRAVDGLSKTLAPDAPLMGNLQGSLREIDRAARALRFLANELQAHPESLLRGRGTDHLR